jgi:hypothetical protein
MNRLLAALDLIAGSLIMTAAIAVPILLHVYGII